MNELVQSQVLKALQLVIPENKQVSLHEPCFAGNEWAYVKECIDTGWVSSVGKFVDQFEKQLAEFTGSSHAIAVVNGTAALHVALRLSGVEANNEVLCPTLTFIASANAIAYCNAIPHFIDIDEKTLGVDPAKLSAYLQEACTVTGNGCFNKVTGRRIKALLVMHTFGHSCDLDPLLELCQRSKIELVEDAAESLGSYYKGRHTGNFGKVSSLSFNGNKIITTGGGGAILTNDPDLGKFAKHLTTTAKVPHKWLFVHDQIGYNYRLPNINAALGCAQLEELPTFIKRKRELAKKYIEAFSAVQGVKFFTEPEFSKSNYWLNTLILDKTNVSSRDQILSSTNSHGIMTRPAWTLMHELEIYKSCPKMPDLSCATDIEQRLINIPSSAFLGI